MTGNESTECFSHQDLQRPRKEKDMADVNAFVELMERSWVNPLSPDKSDIISLSTGMAVSPDLLQAHQTGEQAYQTFRSERLEKESPATKFHDKMRKQNLNTFSSIKTNARVKQVQKKEVVLRADRNLFGRQ